MNWKVVLSTEELYEKRTESDLVCEIKRRIKCPGKSQKRQQKRHSGDLRLRGVRVKTRKERKNRWEVKFRLSGSRFQNL